MVRQYWSPSSKVKKTLLERYISDYYMQACDDASFTFISPNTEVSGSVSNGKKFADLFRTCARKEGRTQWY